MNFRRVEPRATCCQVGIRFIAKNGVLAKLVVICLARRPSRRESETDDEGDKAHARGHPQGSMQTMIQTPPSRCVDGLWSFLLAERDVEMSGFADTGVAIAHHGALAAGAGATGSRGDAPSPSRTTIRELVVMSSQSPEQLVNGSAHAHSLPTQLRGPFQMAPQNPQLFLSVFKLTQFPPH
jgi:hypothetical protein